MILQDDINQLKLDNHAYVGANAAQLVPERAKQLGFERPGVIIDAALPDASIFSGLLTGWESAGLGTQIVYRSRSGEEPDYDYLDTVANEFRSLDLDLLIGIGGGSTLDLTKGVGILMRNPGSGVDYRGMDRVAHPGVPVVAVPSVAGAGSEATYTASFIDRNTKVKLGINGRYVACLFSALDPCLLTTCPKLVTIGSGLDAIIHATEAVTARTADSMSILFGLEALRLLFSSLPNCVAQPDNLDARTNLMLGSYYAAIAQQSAAGGPTTGFQYPIGVHYDVPHGFAGGILFPYVVAMNISKGYYEGYAHIYDRLDGVPSKSQESDEVKAKAFHALLDDMYEALAVPKDYSKWGVSRAAASELAELILSQRKLNLELNPVLFGEDDVVHLLNAVLTNRLDNYQSQQR